MWQRVLDFGKQVFSLTRRVEQHEQETKELRQELATINERLRDQAAQMEMLAYELRREREMAARDRENLMLRLENALLRFERRIPPGPDSDSSGPE